MRLLIVTVCMTALVSCQLGPSRTPLANASPSADAIGAAVLDAIGRRDVDGLRALALSEQEFREHVWPELPASRPERNLPFSYVWGDLRQKSEVSLRDTLARVGGQQLALTAVTFSGETTRYPTFTVHRESVVRVRAGDGTVRDMRLFGSAVEKDGAWKVFSYVVDD